MSCRSSVGVETHLALAYSVVVEGKRLILLFNFGFGIWGVKCENSEETRVFASRAGTSGRRRRLQLPNIHRHI